MSNRRLATVGILSASAIFVAGWALALTGDALAQQTGLGASFVSVGLVAASPSLPELSTTLAAVRAGNHQMAVRRRPLLARRQRDKDLLPLSPDEHEHRVQIDDQRRQHSCAISRSAASRSSPHPNAAERLRPGRELVTLRHIATLT